jgi:hypothetical protein
MPIHGAIWWRVVLEAWTALPDWVRVIFAALVDQLPLTASGPARKTDLCAKNIGPMR